MNDANMPPKTISMDRLRAVKLDVLKLCEDIPGTGSIGIGGSEDGSGPAITVGVMDEASLSLIPAEMDGIPVRAYLMDENILLSDD